MPIRKDESEEINAKVLADLVADPVTTDQLRVRIIQKLLEGREGNDFFRTIFEENVSYGCCPNCNFETHWAVPEEILNIFGWVSSQKDKRVKQHTSEKDCPEYAEACNKKRITV